MSTRIRGQVWVEGGSLAPSSSDVGTSPASLESVADEGSDVQGREARGLRGTGEEGVAQAYIEAPVGMDAGNEVAAGEYEGYENEWYAMVYGFQKQITTRTSQVSAVEVERDG